VALALASALATYVYVQWTDVGGLFLVHDRGYAAATWGLCFGINPILVAVGQYPLARWARRRSPRVILAAGAILQGLGLAMLLPGSPLPWVIASVVVFTLGEMLIAPIATALAASLAPAHLRGSYQGVLNFAFAGAFGPAVFIGVALVGAGHGAWMLGLALPLSILAAALTWPLPSKPFAAEGDRGLAPA
jgi:MFS family permease